MNEEEIQKAMNDFGNLLKEKRKAKGWSQRKLGEKAEIRYPSIVFLENGGNASLENIVRIVDGLGCRLSVRKK